MTCKGPCLEFPPRGQESGLVNGQPVIMLWNIAAPFFHARPDENRWIDDFVPSGGFRFHKVPVPEQESGNWHNRAGRGTPIAGWRRYWRHASEGLKGADGLVTVFPQLATMAGLQRRLSRRDIPIVAWCFNVGAFPGGVRRTAARAALDRIDRFVVHSSVEVGLLANFLAISEQRVQFVPLQRAAIPVVAEERRDAPFIVAMGSANRDYPTLVEAARITGLPVTIVASPRLIAGLDLPANVTARSGLSPDECRVLAQQARFSVVPLTNAREASGQVTVIEAMRMHRAVIATASTGTEDYVEHDRTGLLVPPGDAAALAGAMRRLWDDHEARARLATTAAAFAETHLSDEAAGVALADVLRAVVNGR